MKKPNRGDKKETVVRCSNTVKSKSGENKVCSAFLMALSPNKVVVVCRKCGMEVVAYRDMLGNLQIVGHPKEQHLIDKSKETQCL